MIARLQGGVLSFVLYVSIVVSVILLTMILYAYYTRMENAMYNIGMRLLDNLTSAEQWAMGAGEEMSYGREEVWDLYDTGHDSVSVKKFAWGIYDAFLCQSFYQNKVQRSCFMVGNQFSEEGRSAVYLIDDGRPLSIVGDTRLEGKVYLPFASVKSAFINRTGYTGEKLVYGEVERSDGNLPDLFSYDVLDEFEDHMETLKKTSDYIPTQKASQSFLSDTLLHIDVGDITVSDTLTGFVFIESSGTVTFDTTAYTDHIVVMADQIEFRSGFKGQGQFFASDTIMVHSGAELYFPSVLSVQNEFKTAYIEIKEKSKVAGTLLMEGNDTNDRSRVIKIEEEAEVFGAIYCNGYLEGFGKVNGHTLTKRFLINSFSGVYENYIMNAEYKFELDSNYLAPNGWFESNKKGVVQWLY